MCKTFHVKLTFQSLANTTHFNIKGFALDLTLKQRQKAPGLKAEQKANVVNFWLTKEL